MFKKFKKIDNLKITIIYLFEIIIYCENNFKIHYDYILNYLFYDYYFLIEVKLYYLLYLLYILLNYKFLVLNIIFPKN
jgi:hypothetical protein